MLKVELELLYKKFSVSNIYGDARYISDDVDSVVQMTFGVDFQVHMMNQQSTMEQTG